MKLSQKAYPLHTPEDRAGQFERSGVWTLSHIKWNVTRRVEQSWTSDRNSRGRKGSSRNPEQHTRTSQNSDDSLQAGSTCIPGLIVRQQEATRVSFEELGRRNRKMIQRTAILSSATTEFRSWQPTRQPQGLRDPVPPAKYL